MGTSRLTVLALAGDGVEPFERSRNRGRTRTRVLIFMSKI
jgi:hypothetical protein